jgi:hypothetical protein
LLAPTSTAVRKAFIPVERARSGEQFGCALGRVKGRGEPPTGQGLCRSGTSPRR